MKKFLFVFFFFVAVVPVSAQTPADNAYIVYDGRTAVSDDGVSFDWSGVTVRVRFKGTKLVMNCADSGCDYLNCWIDREPSAVEDRVLKVSSDTAIVLVSALKKGVHEVILQKRTEGEQGCLTVKSFETDGEILPAGGRKSRRIECIGDSYTCGYGVEASGRAEPFRAEEENCNKAYGYILGRFFDADVTLVSHSGRGIVRNYDDHGSFADTMTSRYSQVFDEAGTQEWDASRSSTPDIVIIYLGTNDFSRGKQPSLQSWCEKYGLLLRKVRGNYGDDVPVLCVASKANELMGDYVKAAVERSGIRNVSWTAIQASAHDNEGDLGAAWHPNYQGQRKVAACMAPYVSTLTGWEFPVKPIE